MAKRYRGNAGFIGTASHVEQYYGVAPPSNSKKSRYKCYYYGQKTKMCSKLNITCVGPSNALCKHYRVSTGEVHQVGKLINHPEHGVGMIMTVQGPVCEVKYHRSKEIRKYRIDAIKKMILK